MLIVLFLAGLILVHLAKMLRLYLVLMEQRISFGKFVPVYLETTCVNLVIPFKLGEIYRVFRLFCITGKFPIGLLSVLTDRFFDTASLLLILIPIQLYKTGSLRAVSIILLAFVLLLAFGYMIFPASYDYLNRYIIIHKNSKRALITLKILEFMHEWYEYCRQLIKGRSTLMILFSLIGWGMECVTLKILALLLKQSFGLNEYVAYISSIFGGEKSSILPVYSLTGAVLLGISAVVAWVIYGWKRRKAVR